MATDRYGMEPPDRRDEAAVRVYTCSRIGLRANPPAPRLSLGGWLRRR